MKRFAFGLAVVAALALGLHTVPGLRATAGHRPPQSRRSHRRRSVESHADQAHHVGGARPHVPRTHRGVRRCRSGRQRVHPHQRGCDRGGSTERYPPPPRTTAAPTGRHPGGAQGHHRYGRHADDRWFAVARGLGSSKRCVHHRQAAGGGRHHHRQGDAHRVRELHRHRHAGRLQFVRPVRLQPVRSAPAAGRRRPAGADHRRLQFRIGHRGRTPTS